MLLRSSALSNDRSLLRKFGDVRRRFGAGEDGCNGAEVWHIAWVEQEYINYALSYILGVHMKLYRGPASKDFSDDSHELVAKHDFSKEKITWTEQVRVRLNASKEAYERQSVAHVAVDQNDVLALYEGLVAGLVEKANRLAEVEERELALRGALRSVKLKLELHRIRENENLVADLLEIVADSLK